LVGSSQIFAIGYLECTFARVQLLPTFDAVCLLEVLEDVVVVIELLAPVGLSSALSMRLLVAEDRAKFITGLILDLVQFFEAIEDAFDGLVCIGGA
jgi:hypothetical protein